MRLIEKFFDALRKKSAQKGYTCDACGVEIFSYPTPRLCKKCQSSLFFNNGDTCLKCGRPVRSEGVCKTCKSDLPAFEKGVSALAYFDFSARLVNRFKNGKRYLSFYFAERLYEVLNRLPKKEYVLVAVPLTKEKRRIRGYNQSAELVLRLADLTGFEYRTDLLEKRKRNEQKQLSSKERRENVVGVYGVVDRKYCKGKDFLVVDDILTSGATLSEIASRLLRAGANSVCVAAVAAVPDRDFVTSTTDQTNRLASI